MYRKQHIAIESQNELRSQVEMVEAKLKFIMNLISDINNHKNDDTESVPIDKNDNVPELINLDLFKLQPELPLIEQTQSSNAILSPKKQSNESIMDRIQKYEFIFDSMSDRKNYISWSKSNDADYKPNVYTAVSILKNPNADPDLLA